MKMCGDIVENCDFAAHFASFGVVLPGGDKPLPYICWERFAARCGFFHSPAFCIWLCCFNKQRIFTVPLGIYQYMENCCLRNGIARTAPMFPITTREVQKVLARVCDYLGYEGISTHSFRKWYATEIYKNNGYDIALVQRPLQHSSASVTQRYIGIDLQRIEKAIEGHAELI